MSKLTSPLLMRKKGASSPLFQRWNDTTVAKSVGHKYDNGIDIPASAEALADIVERLIVTG